MIMDITIFPHKLSGTLAAIPSKSQAHRLMICAAFAGEPTRLICPQTNQDIEATADCLTGLGAAAVRISEGYEITPFACASRELPLSARLNVRESGSTLRFLLPIVGALGVDTVFKMEGRLSKRPLSPLWEEMERMGCSLRWVSADELRVTGQLRPGDYEIDGGVSSQFITGLLFAASLLDGESRIHIPGRLESKPYVEMTQKAMALFGVDTAGLTVKGGRPYKSPGTVTVEGDWSNAAFFLAAQALGNGISVTDLDPESAQGDRAVAQWLEALSKRCVISAADIPDLVPILSVVAAAKQGAVFTDIQRLRLKESDRVESTAGMLKALGIRAEATEDILEIFPGKFRAGTVDACGDHRIAMSAAIAATAAVGPVRILGAECVRKSYPGFWEEYKRLGGEYELSLR